MAQRAMRLLLLALLAAGVVGMHTTGHPRPDHAVPMAAAHVDAHAAVDQPAAGVVSPAGPAGAGMDPAEVCLAVLIVFGVLVLVVALWRGVRRVAAGPEAVPRATVALGRGPPRCLPLGLRLAELSVLRT